MGVKTAFLLGFALTALGGCAAHPPIIERAPTGDDAPAIEPTAEPAGEIAFMALSLVGTPYAARGASPEEGFDCSGLVAYVYAHALKLALPRNTVALARSGAPIGATHLQPGDLVFYNTLRRPYSHVGIYLGDSRFVHAPSTGGAVRVEDMRVAYWVKRFNGARRIVQ